MNHPDWDAEFDKWFEHKFNGTVWSTDIMRQAFYDLAYDAFEEGRYVQRTYGVD